MTKQKIPSQIGRYKILSLLGKGSFGTVYEARDCELDRVVALKVLNHKMSHDCLRRFIREANICKTLRHPNVITIFDASIEKDTPYIVLERLNAQALDDIMAVRSFEEEEALSIVVQIAKAIDYLHSEGIFHRDIKPQNIMLTNAGRAVLMDFNLGTSDNLTALTATGHVVGTPLYMAPELWIGQAYTLSSEIYALGLVFHQLLTGATPQVRDWSKEQMDLAVIEPPSKVNPLTTSSYDEFVHWVTHGDCDKRCSSISEFLDRLADASDVAKLIINGRGPIEDTPKELPQEQLITSRQRSFLGLLLLIITTVALTSFLDFQPTQKEKPELDMSFCPFPDGCYGGFKALINNRPSWRLLSSNKLIKEGECTAQGNLWIVQIQGLTGQEEYTLQLLDGSRVFGEKKFKLTTSLFKERLQAFVGLRKVILTWKLHGDVNATTVGTFNKEVSKVISSSRATFKTASRGTHFDYSMFVGKRKIASSRLRLGLESRLSKLDFPKRPKWKVKQRLLTLRNGLVAGSANGIFSLNLERDLSGPKLSLAWLIQTPKKTNPLMFLTDGDSYSLAFLQVNKKLCFMRINQSARFQLGKTVGPPFGSLAGECFIEISNTEMGTPLIATYPIASKSLLVAVIGIDERLYTWILNYKNGKPKIVTGPSLQRTSAVWLGEQSDGPVCIICQDGAVKRLKLTFNKANFRLSMGTLSTLFKTNDKDKVIALKSFRSDVKTKEVFSELSVQPLTDERWAIRAGSVAAFFRSTNGELRRFGPLVNLPTKVSQRTSNALELENDKIGYVLVLQASSSGMAMKTCLFTIDLTKAGKNSMRHTLLGKSALHVGFSAICGHSQLFGSRYFVPALGHVFVVSKSGELLGKIYAEWKPYQAAMVNKTLIVPLSNRKILAVDLLDEL